MTRRGRFGGCSATADAWPVAPRAAIGLAANSCAAAGRVASARPAAARRSRRMSIPRHRAAGAAASLQFLALHRVRAAAPRRRRRRGGGGGGRRLRCTDSGAQAVRRGVANKSHRLRQEPLFPVLPFSFAFAWLIAARNFIASFSVSPISDRSFDVNSFSFSKAGAYESNFMDGKK